MATFDCVTILGAGTIGSSWARLTLDAGVAVRVFDRDPARLEAVRADGIEVFDSLEQALDGADYVQECVPEQLELKRDVLAEIDRLAHPHSVVASSTSAFTMSEMAARVERRERCLVVHPTNPPHIVPLVELVPSPDTDPVVTERARAFMTELGREPIVCRKEIYGFVLNRLQGALEREAFYLVREGVASVADVDKTVREGLGLRWAFLGPFAVEAANADSIEDYLRKYGPLTRRLFESVCQPYSGPDDGDITAAVAGMEEMFGDATQQEIVSYRDRMVLALRALKAADDQPPFA